MHNLKTQFPKTLYGNTTISRYELNRVLAFLVGIDPIVKVWWLTNAHVPNYMYRNNSEYQI